MTDHRDETARIEEFAELLDAALSSDRPLHSTEEFALAVDESDDLSEMLALAGALRATAAPRPRPEFRDTLRAELVAAGSALNATETAPAAPIEAQPPGMLERFRRSLEYLRRSAALATAAATGAFLLSGIGVVAAAEHAQPGDTLYGVKLATENARLTLAGDDVERGRLALQFAERRLDEVVAGAQTQQPRHLTDGFLRMDALTIDGADRLLDAYYLRGELSTVRELSSFLERQTGRLNGVIDQLPVETVPFALDSLDLLRRVEHETGALLATGCVPCENGAGLSGVLDPESLARCCVPPSERGRTDAPTTTPSETGTTSRPADASGDTDPASDEPEPSPSPRLRGIIPVNPDLDSTTSDLDEGTGDLIDTVDDTVDDITGTVDEPIDDVTGTVDDVVDDITDTVDETVDQIDETVDDVIDDVSDDLGSLLGD